MNARLQNARMLSLFFFQTSNITIFLLENTSIFALDARSVLEKLDMLETSKSISSNLWRHFILGNAVFAKTIFLKTEMSLFALRLARNSMLKIEQDICLKMLEENFQKLDEDQFQSNLKEDVQNLKSCFASFVKIIFLRLNTTSQFSMVGMLMFFWQIWELPSCGTVHGIIETSQREKLLPWKLFKTEMLSKEKRSRKLAGHFMSWKTLKSIDLRKSNLNLSRSILKDLLNLFQSRRTRNFLKSFHFDFQLGELVQMVYHTCFACRDSSVRIRHSPPASSGSITQ